MEWEELIAQFRDLGGTAENVRIGKGIRGRGVFVIDPAKPAVLDTPENLIVPVEDVEIRGGRMTIKTHASLGERERSFFDAYQEHFGWGAGLSEELEQSQRQWSRLPAPVVESIRSMGALEDIDQRFLAPTPDVCFNLYVRTRNFDYRGRPHVVPVVEIVNHFSGAAGYDFSSGIGVKGTYADEMLVRYNVGDTWKLAMGSGFNDLTAFAYSLALTVEVHGRQIAIGRDFDCADLRDGVKFPRVESSGGAMRLPYLMLGCSAAPDLPRAIFRSIALPSLPLSQADETFDTIVRFNKAKFLALVRTLREYDGPIVSMLKDAAINQMDRLACCIGARTLPGAPV